ncbi:ABC-type amino acid transport substrate-binding protein [Desulfobotulus alkaliphilus]|uniref:ABC-type amino acid transport substrate-binding protein n=1 Tax=Desulfobotulus alkaliphilus TaxID=622671 RepID=A0A562SA14_9BACT|nr:transporter substrate-binding domain-containing protein [Desulfobotulus alkaliphilus]TWI77356.1 ABC-type amino acid transport substrate-binding protein [Desulfobotulus alkaliphilus]
MIFPFFRRFLFSIILLTTLCLGQGNLRADIPYVLATDPMPPLVEGSYGPASGGPAIELVSAIFAKTGNSVQVLVHPWNRVLRMLDFGRLDGILLIQHQDELDDLLHFSHPVFTSHTIICYDTRRHPNFEYKDIESLKGYTLGLIPGHSPGIEKKADSHQLDIENLPSIETGLRTLGAGRIDLLIGKEISIAERMKDIPQSHFFSIWPVPLESWDMHIGIAKNSPASALLKDINRAIEEMKADGSLESYFTITQPVRGEP